MEQIRTLPLRVAPADGESLHSWLLRLARRNGIPMLRLAAVLGFGDRLRVRRNYALSWRIPPELLRRTETQAGLTHGTLNATVLDQFDPLRWKPIPGSRYCTGCLAETGTWHVRWQLPYVFACLEHRCLLAAVCPRCRRAPHSAPLPLRAGVVPVTRCLLRAGTELAPCETDLLTHPTQRLRGNDSRLSAQAWVDQRLSDLSSTAVDDLRDLDTLAVWFRQRLEPADLRHLGADAVTAMNEYRNDNHGFKREQPTATVIAAAVTVHALRLINASERQRYQRFRPLMRDVSHPYSNGASSSLRGPQILPHKRLSALSQPLRRKLLLAADPHLPVSERLRYRTCTPGPQPPGLDSTAAAERARFIPQYLWPDWIIRLQPLRGSHANDIAIDIPRALMLPGNPARNIHATRELNPWRNNVTIYLGEATRHHPDILTALCRIASYLDTNGGVIDYRRRRATFPNVDLSQQEWDNICRAAHTHPGRSARLRNARRYMFQMLTGADLGNPSHPLAITTSTERDRYLIWQRDMPSPLRQEIRAHASELLTDAGIDEPLTWSPPAQCAAGLHLPGREPGDIDTAKPHQCVIIDGLSTTAAASKLGVCPEHVRYTLQGLDRPARPYHKNSTISSRVICARAETTLTLDFFQRENFEAGKDIATITAETGLSGRVIRHYARLAGYTFIRPQLHTRIKAPRARKGDRTDHRPREHAGTLFPANDDTASELDLHGEPIRRDRANYAIPDRTRGSAGHIITNLKHPNLPHDIRRAVEGQRNGWQRLQRFQQMLEQPSMNTAAQAMRLHTQNLNRQIQRLETDIGTQLLHRAPHRYTPMVPTNQGRHLLQHLQQPAVRELLNRYANANAHPKCGPYKTKTGRKQRLESGAMIRTCVFW